MASGNEQIQTALSRYEARFGSVQDDFPPSLRAGSARRPRRPVGYDQSEGSDVQTSEAAVDQIDGMRPDETAVDSNTIHMMQFSGGVATVSMLYMDRSRPV